MPWISKEYPVGISTNHQATETYAETGVRNSGLRAPATVLTCANPSRIAEAGFCFSAQRFRMPASAPARSTRSSPSSGVKVMVSISERISSKASALVFSSSNASLVGHLAAVDLGQVTILAVKIILQNAQKRVWRCFAVLRQIVSLRQPCRVGRRRE